MFDVTMGSFDGVEICDLVGLYLLHHLAEKFGRKFVGLYRDDGLAIVQGKSARIADNVRKELHEIFKAHGLRITAEINHHTVNFLDITLNLSDGTYAPHINRNSNHPPAIIKQLPKSINKRISSLSANHSLFESTAPVYILHLHINLVLIQIKREHHPHQIPLDEETSFGSTPHLVSPSKQTLVKPS